MNLEIAGMIVDNMDFIVLIITWLCGIVTGKVFLFIRTIKLKRILQLKHKSSIVISPVRTGVVSFEDNCHATEIHGDFLTFSEHNAVCDVWKILNKVGRVCSSYAHQVLKQDTLVSDDVFLYRWTVVE